MKPAPTFQLGGNASDAYYERQHHRKANKDAKSELKKSYLDAPHRSQGEMSHEKHREIL